LKPLCRTGAALFFSLLFILTGCGHSTLHRVPAKPAPVQTNEFAAQMAEISHTPWTSGNSVRTLVNGDGFFPPMLRAAAGAKRSITFECYTARDCEPVAEFSRILAEKAKAGVQVHVTLDAFGCWPWGDHHIEAMKKAGVHFKLYSPFNFFLPLNYNHRTHRRVLVVDGRVGFCGGAGWAYNWTGNAQDPTHWRDTQYELRGPVVAHLQDNFNDNWEELTGRRLCGDGCYPPPARAGNTVAQMVAGSPFKRGDTIGASNLLAIRAARKSILMEHSYFLPNAEFTKALRDAAARGVRVEIIIPGEITDMPFAKEITHGTLRTMMNEGISIYEYQPTMMHGKLLVVDDHLVIAGSGNLDSRSFYLNDENNLHVLDSAVAREQRRMFERDRAKSIPLSEETLKLPIWRRARGFFGHATKFLL
jgi:cardiolipin synthase